MLRCRFVQLTSSSSSTTKKSGATETPSVTGSFLRPPEGCSSCGHLGPRGGRPQNGNGANKQSLAPKRHQCAAEPKDAGTQPCKALRRAFPEGCHPGPGLVRNRGNGGACTQTNTNNPSLPSGTNVRPSPRTQARNHARPYVPEGCHLGPGLIRNGRTAQANKRSLASKRHQCAAEPQDASTQPCKALRPGRLPSRPRPRPERNGASKQSSFAPKRHHCAAEP